MPETKTINIDRIRRYIEHLEKSILNYDNIGQHGTSLMLSGEVFLANLLLKGEFDVDNV